MWFSGLLIVGGLIVLTAGAEALVEGAASVARRFGLSSLVIGLTVVSVGTSLPELVVSLEAAFGGSGDLALGNVVGSNIGNATLILGTAALIQPIAVQVQIVRTDAPILIVASLVFVGVILDGVLSRMDGLLLVGGVVAYVSHRLWAAARASDASVESPHGTDESRALWIDLILLGGGILGLIAGARLLVTGAVAVAEGFGVGSVVIGLTVVALGTSLPELATSVVAALHGQGDITVGNVLGSSIFNVLGILGSTALVYPLPTAALRWVDLAFFLGTAILLWPLFRSDWTLNRLEGGLLVGIYVSYLVTLVLLGAPLA